MAEFVPGGGNSMERHDTLLFVSTQPELRMAYRGILDGHYNLLEAGNIRQAKVLLEQNYQCIAAVMLDVSEQDRISLEDFGEWSTSEVLEQMPVIIITANEDPVLLNRAFQMGALDVIPSYYDPVALLHRVENIIELNLYKQQLSHLVEEQAKQLHATNDTVVDALSSIIEYRSVESGQHILRIRHFTKILLEELVRCCPEYQLRSEDIRNISSAAALHDIGKISIPDAILMKPGKLTDEERQIMQGHSLTGCKILESLSSLGNQEYLRYAHNICHYHHERWDGNGYPEGLSGEDIPICAQVVGLADAYDALTSKRVYKEAYSFDTAVNMILQGKCGAFSPKLLECFKHVAAEYEAIGTAYADGLAPEKEAFDTVLQPPESAFNNDSMERIWSKYQALVHYAGAFLIELDIDQSLFHLIYNPYPELVFFRNINSFGDITRLVMEKLVVSEQKEQMRAFLNEGIHTFLQEGMRRRNYRFHFKSKENPQGEPFDLTLLRINPTENGSRTLAVLCKKVENGGGSGGIQRVAIPLEYTYCCLCNPDFTLEYTDDHVTHLAGYTQDELFALFGGNLIELVVPEDRDILRADVHTQLNRGTDIKVIYRVKHKNGEIRWYLNQGRLFVGEDGQERLLCSMTDISPSRKESDALKQKLERYEIILAQTENVLFEWDIVNDNISFSDTWEKIFGFTPIQQNVRQALVEGSFFHPDDLPMLLERLQFLETGSAYEVVEVRIAKADGRYLWCRFRATAIRDEEGKLSQVMGVIINIDTEKQAEQALLYQAEQDSLTQLLNKEATRRYAESYFQQKDAQEPCALMIIDLDDFKMINDRYGHLFGDAVLTKVALEIKRLFRNRDIIGRIGGDEFLVLLRGTADRNLVETRCTQLVEVLREAFRESYYHIPLTCSIGIALGPEHGNSYYELFQHADTALYRVKSGGKHGFSFYSHADETAQSMYHDKSAINQHIDSDEQPDLTGENIVHFAFQRLYSAQDVNAAMNDILAMIGQQTNVSRVYIFENTPDNRFCNNTYEWCNHGIQPEIQNLQNISYETDIPGYELNFDESGIFYCPDISVLPKAAYEIVEAQGIKSMLQCAIRENGIFRGYIGFDECVTQRFWTKKQIQTLTFFAEMLSVFLLKDQAQKRTQQRATELSSILDNQNAWIYIIDPDTCELKYLNKKAKTLMPDSKPGAKCYQAFQDMPHRCPGCPSAQIREKQTDKAIIQNKKFDLCVQAEATLIQWDGQESCLLTCRDLREDTK